MKILIILSIFLITSCSSIDNTNQYKIERKANDFAMTECEQLTQLQDKSFKSVVLKLQEVIDLYRICEVKRDTLQKFIENEVK